ncbi:hypothetical protein RYX36_034872 [Vicia faba]
MDALDAVHISKGDQENVFAILVEVLWLRNISFTVINNENHIQAIEDEGLFSTAKLIGCEIKDLKLTLSTRIMKVDNGIIVQKLTLSQASDARDTLAKSIYAYLFDWLIEQINKSLAIGKRRTGKSISILDIYGFESFNRNSFEQFCINYQHCRSFSLNLFINLLPLSATSTPQAHQFAIHPRFFNINIHLTSPSARVLHHQNHRQNKQTTITISSSSSDSFLKSRHNTHADKVEDEVESSKWEKKLKQRSQKHTCEIRSNLFHLLRVDDAEEFRIVMDALDVVHNSKGDQENVFAMLDAVLWLRNISFTVINNENHIQVVEDDELFSTAKLIGCEIKDLKLTLSTRKMKVGKGIIVQKLTLSQLFGSDDLVQASVIFKFSDEDRLHSFSESYKLGTNLVEGVHSPNLASLNSKLVPEHFLYLSIDRGRKFLLSSKSANRYNFTRIQMLTRLNKC